MKTEDEEARRRAIEDRPQLAGWYNPDTGNWGVTNIKKVDRGLGRRYGETLKDGMFFFCVDEFSEKDMRSDVEGYFERHRPQ